MDPVELQVLTGALHAICEEMGAVLIRSAHSANIKERRDASTALFTPEGEMVMQAEHIPVHLGAMPAAVASVLYEDHAPERSWILNDPYRGGTHLPDITVITPVYAGGGDGPLIAFAASRAHHADVGGPTPGSMPADSTTLSDEGVVIEPRVLDEAAIAELAGQMRRPDQRRADLRAQLAAGRVGALRLAQLAGRVGVEALREAYAEVLDYAERRTRACLAELKDGERRAQDVLEAREGDLRIVLRATVCGDELTLDFTGTDDQHEGNLNCPEAVTRSACYFAVRVLSDPDIPANAGAYRPIRVIAPEGCLLNARSPAAVVGGNVETSSRVADVVLGAFGQALGPGHDEQRHARRRRGHLLRDDRRRTGRLRRRRRAQRRPRGHEQHAQHADRGAGARVPDAHDRVLAAPRLGGHGALSEAATASYARSRPWRRCTTRSSPSAAAIRRRAPMAVEPGACGRNLLDGEELPPKSIGELAAGQRLRIETPGGGGFGAPD